jgi:hypothetical protein
LAILLSVTCKKFTLNIFFGGKLILGLIYTIPYTGTITNAGGDTDLLELLPADDKPVLLRGLLLSQISEVGDAMEEGLRITIIHMAATVTSGSGGSAVTPQPVDTGTAGVAAECNNTTVATTSGASTPRVELGWNIRNSPYELWFPDDRFAPRARQGEALLVRLQTTPADDFTGCFTFWIEEL